MPDLPPIGSLWRHRVSGERRFVICANSRVRWVEVWTYEGKTRWSEFDNDVKVWLAWQAEADRIDREDA